MCAVFIALLISYFFDPSYVRGEDKKRILLNDPATIQSMLHQYETQLNKYGNALQEVQVKVAQLESENAKLKMALEANNQPGTPNKSLCSFYVSLSNDLHLHTGASVIFDAINLNENNCYNNGDGVFVASLGGIYIFLWKITTHTGGKAGVHIHKNGQITGISLLVKTYDSKTTVQGEVNHNSISDFAILRLQKGDHVNLVISEDNSFIHAGHSGFGGFYLRE